MRIVEHVSDHIPSMVGQAVLLAGAIASLAHAERLPSKVYTTADGLVHNSVHRIVSDSRGLLWFCTAEGLSRFDGYSFKNYGVTEGLPDPNVYDMLETRSGVYWVATGSGLCRSQDRKSGQTETKPFNVHTLPAAAGLEVHSLAEGHDGTLWVGTAKGLSRAVRGASGERFQLVDPQVPNLSNWPVTALLEDDFQSLWIGTGNGLYRRWPDGRLERYRASALDEGARPWINMLRQDGQGRIWVSTNKGLLSLKPTRLGCSDERLFTHRPGIRVEYVFDAVTLADHSLWAVLLDGVSRLFPDTPQIEVHFEPVTSSIGLADFPLEAIALDRDRNIWIGSDGGGVSRIARNGFVSFSEADGLGSHDIVSVFENPRGQLFVVSRSRDALFLNMFSEGRFRAIRINIPSDLVSIRWHGHYQVIINSTGKHWWVATRSGLARFTGIEDPAELASARPQYYRPDENIFRLFQDRRGDLWISNQHYPENVLTIRNRRTGAFDRFPSSNGGPDLGNDRIQAYSEDRAGAVWMGLEHGGLWRRSTTGFQHFGFAEGAPGKSINWLYSDSAGRIWIGSSIAGASRIDKPESNHPTFVSYTTGQGLSSNEIQCITEDLAGRIYLCTARGVDQLEPTTGHVKHYSTADGLVGGELQAAFRDHLGALWFGTQQGLSRFVPTNGRPTDGVPVILSGVRVEGDALAMSPGGATKVSLPDLSPGRDRVQFDFTGLSFKAGDVLRYQFMLEGAEEKWGAPTPQRSVIYAGLRPGSYRFLVQAVNSDGLLSPQPASVTFTILAPIWLRWWFILAVFGAISFAVYAAWRYRARQLAAVQRVRMRIATDLHDDIGSGLSQIAILSEVVRRQSSQGAGSALDQIADVSRDLVDSMSDIVWATDPNRDQVGDLAQRMRQFAGEVLGGSEIEFHLMLGGVEEERKLSVNLRRQVYLVFKECINNVVHHSGSTEARVSLSGDANSLVLEVSDNGKGFDVSRDCLGHGLASMRERAASLGGNIKWTSGERGTTVRMRVPLHD
jgi:signal transduction histidine kinase/ligand-binding sensor domain-containing protein